MYGPLWCKYCAFLRVTKLDWLVDLQIHHHCHLIKLSELSTSARKWSLVMIFCGFLYFILNCFLFVYVCTLHYLAFLYTIQNTILKRAKKVTNAHSWAQVRYADSNVLKYFGFSELIGWKIKLVGWKYV